MARSARKALRGCQADFPRAASNSRSARWSAITTSVTNGSQNLGTGLSLFRGLPEAAALRLGSALTAEGSWPEESEMAGGWRFEAMANKRVESDPLRRRFALPS